MFRYVEQRQLFLTYQHYIGVGFHYAGMLVTSTQNVYSIFVANEVLNQLQFV